MPGTFAHDAGATKLHSAVDVATATTTTGDGVQVGRPGWVRFKQTTGAITGADTTLDTTIEGSNDDSTYVPIAKFAQLIVTDDSETHWVSAYVAYDYVRAVSVSAGAAVDVPDLTVTIEEPHFQRLDTDSA
jgi:hypothetical protein